MSGIHTHISSYAQSLLALCKRAPAQKLSEADFRRPVDNLLEEFCRAAGLEPLLRAEHRLEARGRADTVLNRFVIEYERPGKLAPDLSHPATAQAIEQVRRYLAGLATAEGHQLSRLAGAVLDGSYLVFIRYHEERFQVEKPVPVTEQALQRFLWWLANTASGIALTAENLHRDFSLEQKRTQDILRAFFQGLKTALPQHPMVHNLFAQWRLFFSQSVDYSEAFGGNKLEPLKKWAGRAAFTIHNGEEAELFFFVLHTYFALLLKLLAWLALSRHLALRLGFPAFGELVSADSETLRCRLTEDLESGGLFRRYGLTNLLEGDFFSWYLYAWNDPIYQALQGLLRRLDEYDPATLSIYPEESRDLFKKLYHTLLPREIRHNLGEYYTPDWLAEYLLSQVAPDFFAEPAPHTENALREKLLHTRWLDPACGSGTFLVLLIARLRHLARTLQIDETRLLHTLLHNLVGFDINPLAVLTARVNYLLAIADLLEFRKGEITLPIYLADSVKTPTAGETLLSAHTYEFPTVAGTFEVPASLCVPDRFDRFCSLLETSLQQGLSLQAFLNQVRTRLSVLTLAPADETTLRTLYTTIQKLHAEGRDGIWARLLKNLFAPLTLGQFDCIVGNPPWINWEHLPDAYRQKTKPLWERYGLFPHGGMDTILGKGKKDLSMLMTFTTMDTLLKAGGRLGFVITQSLFKTAGAGQGFRQFRILQPDGQAIPLRVVQVDDLVALNPFEGASNRTALMVLEKGQPTTYPVPYILWQKQKGIRFTYDSSLDEVMKATRRLPLEARPVHPDDHTSSWLTLRPQVYQALTKVLGQSDYIARAGANSGGANAVYWLEIIDRRPDGLLIVRNLTEGAKVEVPEVTEVLEPDLVYPLLRGRDVTRWQARPSAWILMVQDPKKRRGYDETWLQTHYPHTYGYLKRFEGVLRQRAALKRYFTRKDRSGTLIETGPFYSMFNVGPYTFAPWKVVWTRLAKIEAAVAGPCDGRPVMPQETITLVECQGREEAHYICALVNSSPFQLAATSYSQSGGKSMGSMHVLENIRIPCYEPGNPIHDNLSELSVLAHEAVGRGDLVALERVEREIDGWAARVWGLSEAELEAIRESLRELSGAVES